MIKFFLAQKKEKKWYQDLFFYTFLFVFFFLKYKFLLFPLSLSNTSFYFFIISFSNISFYLCSLAYNIDYSQTSFSSKSSTKLCQISYGKLTRIYKQSHTSTFSTLPHGDHALFGHAQKYRNCTLFYGCVNNTCLQTNLRA